MPVAGAPTRFLVEPPTSFQVQAVPVVEAEAFLFEQASLEGVATIAGWAICHFALGIDDTRLGRCRLERASDDIGDGDLRRDDRDRTGDRDCGAATERTRRMSDMHMKLSRAERGYDVTGRSGVVATVIRRQGVCSPDHWFSDGIPT